MKKAIIVFILILVAGTLWTQVEAGRQSQAEMNMQAAKDFQKADKELNRVYAKLNKALEPSKRKRLVTAQRAWIKFRDAESDFWASEMEGGSAEPMLYSGHQAQMTKQRTRELNEAYKTLAEPR